MPEATAQGTPWQLGVRCDGLGCDVNFEGDFIVAEDATRGGRLRVVLDWAANNGWRVEWREPIGDSLAYCPPCSSPVPPDPGSGQNTTAPPSG